MSRVWTIGTVSTPGNGNLGAGIQYALFPWLGQFQDPLPALDDYHPFLCTPDQALQIYYRVQIWRMRLTYQFTNPSYDTSGDWDTFLYDPSSDEKDIIQAAFSLRRFDQIGVEANGETYTPPIVPIGSTLGSGTFRVLYNLPMGSTGPDLIRYYTDGVNFLPEMQFLIGVAGNDGVKTISTAPLIPTPGGQIQDSFAGTINGNPISVSITADDSHTFVSGTFSLTPYLFWTYTGTEDPTPIYDSATGAILPGKTPITQIF